MSLTGLDLDDLYSWLCLVLSWVDLDYNTAALLQAALQKEGGPKQLELREDNRYEGKERGGGKERRDGVIRVSTDLGVREMTELTPEPCHILLSASVGSIRGRGIAVGREREVSPMKSRGSWRDGARARWCRRAKPALVLRVGARCRPSKVYNWLLTESSSQEGSQEGKVVANYDYYKKKEVIVRMMWQTKDQCFCHRSSRVICFKSQLSMTRGLMFEAVPKEMHLNNIYNTYGCFSLRQLESLQLLTLAFYYQNFLVLKIVDAYLHKEHPSRRWKSMQKM